MMIIDQYQDAASLEIIEMNLKRATVKLTDLSAAERRDHCDSDNTRHYV